MVEEEDFIDMEELDEFFFIMELFFVLGEDLVDMEDMDDDFFFIMELFFFFFFFMSKRSPCWNASTGCMARRATTRRARAIEEVFIV